MPIDFSKLEKVKTAEDLILEEEYGKSVAYLRNTDWYVVRKLEIGVEIPVEVVEGRAAARKQIKDSGL
jgi:hypothetical protein